MAVRKPKIALIPNAVSSAVLHNSIPEDGSADFVVARTGSGGNSVDANGLLSEETRNNYAGITHRTWDFVPYEKNLCHRSEGGVPNYGYDGSLREWYYYAVSESASGGWFRSPHKAPKKSIFDPLAFYNTGTTNDTLTGVNIEVPSTGTYTFSVWVKGDVGGERFGIAIRNSASQGGGMSYFNATDEWVRYSVTHTVTATDRGIQIRLEWADGEQMIHLWGIQLESGDTMTSYEPRITVAQEFDIGGYYKPVTGVFLNSPRNGTVNMMDYSEDFTQVNYSKSNVTVTANAAVSPDGTNNATLITDTASAAGANMIQSEPVSASTQYTASYFIKPENDTIDQILFRVFDNSPTLTPDMQMVFSFKSKTFIRNMNGNESPDSFGVHEYPNGWYRIWVTFTTKSDTTQVSTYLQFLGAAYAYTHTADVWNKVYTWGWQLEAGSTPSAYQKKATTTDATRNITAIDDCDFNFNSKNITFFVEASFESGASNSALAISGGTSNYRIRIRNILTDDTKIYYSFEHNAVTDSTSTYTLPNSGKSTSLNKIVIQIWEGEEGNDNQSYIRFWVNGVLANEDKFTNENALDTWNTLSLTAGDDVNTPFKGILKSIMYWDELLTPEEIAQL